MAKWLAELAINSVIRLACTVMTESGLGGRFWFKAAAASSSQPAWVDASNITFKHCLREKPWTQMYGEPKNVHNSVQ